VSGLSYIQGNSGHAPVPLAGSYVRESDGKPASLVNQADYPVIAECKFCQGRLRLGHLVQWEWQHSFAAVTPVTGGDAG
jgi:hypothetical protein